MAVEHNVRPLGAEVFNHPNLSYAAQYEQEGATQTFTAGTPVVWSAGLLVAATDPISSDDNTVTGIALKDGNNAAVSVTNLCKFIPAVDGVVFYGNIMTGDGADYVLEAAVLGVTETQALSSKSGLIVTSQTDWFLDDADANGTNVVSFKSDIIPANQDITRSQVGDTNARVGFVFLTTVRTYPTT